MSMPSFNQIERSYSTHLNKYSGHLNYVENMASDDAAPDLTPHLADDGWEDAAVDEQAESLEIEDFTLIDELTHPMRGRIVRRLRTPHSAAEMADQLDMPVTRLYHHLNRLEQRGLIQVVATRRVGAATERRYQAVARSFQIAHRVFDDLDRRELALAMGALFDVAKIGLQKVVESGALKGEQLDRQAMLSLGEVILGPDRRADLLTQLRAIVDACDSEDGGERMTLFVAAYPESN
jgi:DNA-binding transcriptional ArsR family regulator